MGHGLVALNKEMQAWEGLIPQGPGSHGQELDFTLSVTGKL